MIEIGRGVYIEVGNDVSLSDIINNPYKHHWKISWDFPDNEKRNRFLTPNGKSYGTSSTYQEIYDSLRDDFISLYFDHYFLYSEAADYGETLFSDLSTDLRITINSYINNEGEVKEFERKWDISTTRLQNAQERYDSYWERANARLESIEDRIEDLTSVARLTTAGNIDRRTREAHQINSLEMEKLDIWEEGDKLTRNVRREQKRVANAYDRYNVALSSLRYLQQNIDAFDGRFEEKAEEFAKMVKEDIISKGRAGILPTQNIPLMERTLRNRRRANIPETPRYWATGQLIKSIIITCQIV